MAASDAWKGTVTYPHYHSGELGVFVVNVARQIPVYDVVQRLVALLGRTHGSIHVLAGPEGDEAGVVHFGPGKLAVETQKGSFQLEVGCRPRDFQVVRTFDEVPVWALLLTCVNGAPAGAAWSKGTAMRWWPRSAALECWPTTDTGGSGIKTALAWAHTTFLCLPMYASSDMFCVLPSTPPRRAVASPAKVEEAAPASPPLPPVEQYRLPAAAAWLADLPPERIFALLRLLGWLEQRPYSAEAQQAAGRPVPTTQPAFELEVALQNVAVAFYTGGPSLLAKLQDAAVVAATATAARGSPPPPARGLPL